MGVISKVVDAIDDDEIRSFINQDIDRDYTYCDDWEVEMNHVNVYLNKLLLDMLDKSDSRIPRRASTNARHVLQSVTQERYIRSWVADLKQHYFPVLEKVWVN